MKMSRNVKLFNIIVRVKKQNKWTVSEQMSSSVPPPFFCDVSVSHSVHSHLATIKFLADLKSSLLLCILLYLKKFPSEWQVCFWCMSMKNVSPHNTSASTYELQWGEYFSSIWRTIHCFSHTVHSLFTCTFHSTVHSTLTIPSKNFHSPVPSSPHSTRP